MPDTAAAADANSWIEVDGKALGFSSTRIHLSATGLLLKRLDAQVVVEGGDGVRLCCGARMLIFGSVANPRGKVASVIRTAEDGVVAYIEVHSTVVVAVEPSPLTQVAVLTRSKGDAVLVPCGLRKMSDNLYDALLRFSQQNLACSNADMFISMQEDP